jgi:hypothetical protein
MKELEGQVMSDLAKEPLLKPEGQKFSIPLNKARPRNEDELKEVPPNSIVFPPKEEKKEEVKQTQPQPTPTPQPETPPKKELTEEEKQKLEELKNQAQQQIQEEARKDIEGKSG